MADVDIAIIPVSDVRAGDVLLNAEYERIGTVTRTHAFGLRFICLHIGEQSFKYAPTVDLAVIRAGVTHA